MNAEASMTEEQGAPVKQIIVGLLPSSAAGLAKAAPGVAVGGLSLAGIQIDDWVSILTCGYLSIMFFGAIPKAWDTVRFFRRKFRDTSSKAHGPIHVTVVRNNAGIDKAVADSKGAEHEAPTSGRN